MRYFSYISDAKVEMLLPQIPAGKGRKRSAELGFNVAVLSGKLQEGAEVDSRVSRLLTVEKHIRETEHSDRSSWLSEKSVSARCVYLEKGAVFWVSGDASHLVVLAGSARHLTAGAGLQQRSGPYSELAGIRSLVKETVPERAIYLDGFEDLPDEPRVSADMRWISNLAEWVKNTCQTAQSIGFLARLLLSGREGHATVTLASPLYVELAQ